MTTSSTPRRRVLRTRVPDPSLDRRHAVRRERWNAQLAKDRSSLKRWLTRLKRATNTVTQLHQRIRRLEVQIHDGKRQ